MNDLKAKYDLDHVEIVLKNAVLEFTLEDLENDHRTPDEFEALALEMDHLLKYKYLKLFSAYKRAYLFAGSNGFEASRININKNGKIEGIKEL